MQTQSDGPFLLSVLRPILMLSRSDLTTDNRLLLVNVFKTTLRSVCICVYVTSEKNDRGLIDTSWSQNIDIFLELKCVR